MVDLTKCIPFLGCGTKYHKLNGLDNKNLLSQSSESQKSEIKVLTELFLLRAVSKEAVQRPPTLCDPMDCSTPGFPVHHQLLELAQTHAHQVGDAIQPSHPLLFPSLPTFNLSQNQGLFQWVSSSHQVARVIEFQLQISPSNEYSGLVSGQFNLVTSIKILSLNKVTFWSTRCYNCNTFFFFIVFICVLRLSSHARLFATPWTVAYEAYPSMGFSRQGYWSRLPFPSPYSF